MSNSKHSKGSKSKRSSSKSTKSRSSGSWRSIIWLLVYTGLTWNAPDEPKFNLNLNLDFSHSQFNVNIAKAAPCCDKAVASPYV